MKIAIQKESDKCIQKSFRYNVNTIKKIEESIRQRSFHPGTPSAYRLDMFRIKLPREKGSLLFSFFKGLNIYPAYAERE